MSAVKQRRDPEDERVRRLCYRVRLLPQQLDRARRRVVQLENEAINLGLHNVEGLRGAADSGDLIAAEWLRRLGE